MIVRILGEGQWRIEDAVVADLNRAGRRGRAGRRHRRPGRAGRALHALLEEVRTQGQTVPDDELSDSDLILPAADSTLEDVRALLDASDEGLIPG